MGHPVYSSSFTIWCNSIKHEVSHSNERLFKCQRQGLSTTSDRHSALLTYLPWSPIQTEILRNNIRVEHRSSLKWKYQLKREYLLKKITVSFLILLFLFIWVNEKDEDGAPTTPQTKRFTQTWQPVFLQIFHTTTGLVGAIDWPKPANITHNEQREGTQLEAQFPDWPRHGCQPPKQVTQWPKIGKNICFPKLQKFLPKA